MKAVVAAFNQEKALVGAFSVITNLRMELFEALLATAHLSQMMTHKSSSINCAFKWNVLWRLQKVTIEDVEDEEPDVSPAPLSNGEKVGRDNSFSSSKFSDKTSIKVHSPYIT